MQVLRCEWDVARRELTAALERGEARAGEFDQYLTEAAEADLRVQGLREEEGELGERLEVLLLRVRGYEKAIVGYEEACEVLKAEEGETRERLEELKVKVCGAQLRPCLKRGNFGS